MSAVLLDPERHCSGRSGKTLLQASFFVPTAICAESSKLPGARGQGEGPAVLPLGLAGAGRPGVQGYECVKVSVPVYVWSGGVVGGAEAGGRRKGASETESSFLGIFYFLFFYF